MGDVTDCLSAAYDCVSRLIAGKPSKGEEREWRGFEDRRQAEDRWMPWLAVELDENGPFVYALASVPGCAGKDALIGLDGEWLAILGQRKTDGLQERPYSNDARACSQESRAAVDTAPAQSFCVISLPAEVNPIDSVAVLAKGVLGIRMPKTRG